MTEKRLIPTRTHNQILAVMYSVFGGINLFMIMIALAILAFTEEEPLLHLRLGKVLVLVILLVLLSVSVIYLVTGIGLWKKRRWARTSALILGVMFAWYLPVGLGLGLYAWLFLRSEAGKRLYAESSR
jgi:hypothetical protein